MGGHQERNKRAGTENVAGIVGIGTAVNLIYNEFDSYNNKLKRLLHNSNRKKHTKYKIKWR
jgi:cysteine desulfurase